MSHNTVSGYLETLNIDIASLSGVSVVDGIIPVPADGTPTRLVVPTYNDSGVFGSSVRGQRYRGTSGSPAAINAGDVLLQVVGDGYDGTNLASGKASLVFMAAESWAPGANGTFVRIRTTPTGATGALSRLYIGQDGRVGVGTDVPSFTLDVNGSGNFASGLYVNGVAVSTGSGVTEAQLAATGQQATVYADGVGTNLSGALAQSGANLLGAIIDGDINLSGVVAVTGQVLDGRISSLSGYVVASDGALDQRITQTGGAAIGYANSVGSILSGAVASTGSLLYITTTGLSGALVASLEQTGQQSIAYATSSALNLSGDLVQTGIQLGAQVVAASAVSSGNTAQTGAAAISFALGASGALQSQISAGNGTQVRVTGSSTLSIADVTGIGGVQVFSLGGQVFISGSQGGAGGVPSVNDITSAVTFVGTGGLTVSVQGANVLVSGDSSISGALTQTGVVLGAQIGALSGYVNQASGGLEARIAQTGGAAVAYSNGVGANLSGNLTQTGAAAVTHANGIGQVLSGNLTATGQTLVGLIVGMSGQGSSDYATKAQVTTTGATLGTQVNALSGFVIAASGGLELRIAQSGASAVAQANGIGQTISGNLTTTGQTLVALITNMSGQGGTDYATKTQLTNTGVTLGGQITSLSGFVGQASGGIEARVAQTGAASVSYATAYANGVGANVSGNLAQTGVALTARDLLVSGWLTTGIAQTGAASVAHANGIGVNLSGSLTQTGVQVQSLIYGGDTNLSGALTQTGSTLNTRIASLSGFTLGASGALQTQITAGAGTQVKVTGSATLGTADLTGIGGIIVLSSGGQVFISGGAGGGGVPSINGITSATTIAGTGGLSVITQGSVILVSGDQSISGVLTQTGVALGSKIDVLSGFVEQASGGLEARIAQSGSAALSYANGLGTNLSGNLTLTGQTLQARIASLSGFTLDASGALQAQISAGGSQVRVSGSESIAIADFSGIGGVAVVYSGSQILVSGSAGGPGGGVPSVNGIADAVTIAGSGGTSVSTVGSTIYVSSPQLPMVVNFTAGSITATNMPAALAFFANSSAYITYADLSRFTGVALYINKAGTAGAAASRLFLRYRDAFNTTASNWTQDITSPVMQFPVNVTNTLITSGFQPLVDEARSGVYLALMGTGGDGVLDPVFGIITAQFM